LRVSVRSDDVTYYLREGDHEDGSRLDLVHHGEFVTVEIGKPVTLPIPPAADPEPPPEQPAGRAPLRRTYSVD
jgi:alpha,alpha-trehalose phosphorylase